MSAASRDKLLGKLETPAGRSVGQRLSNELPGDAPLLWEEIGYVVEGLALAQRPIRAAASEVTSRYGLGPRGAFILSLIQGGLLFPHELAEALKTGRSLITAELARLTDAGLIASRPGATDRRRTELSLTEEGARACEEVRSAMQRILLRNLSGYTPEQIRLFGHMLHDCRRLDPTESEDAEAC